MKRLPKKIAQEFEWRITRIKSTPAARHGTVFAPDAETAIKRAIVEYEITNREHQDGS
jgi:hypothetical protein